MLNKVDASLTFNPTVIATLRLPCRVFLRLPLPAKE